YSRNRSSGTGISSGSSCRTRQSSRLIPDGAPMLQAAYGERNNILLGIPCQKDIGSPKIRVSSPPRARRWAAVARPYGPAPTIATSIVSAMDEAWHATPARPTAGAGPSPARSTPAATPRSTPAFQPVGRVGPAGGGRRDPAAGVGVLRPSSESDDVTRLLLLLLAGLLVLVVIPTQVAKGVAQRRRRAALATARLRRSRPRP